MFQMMSRMFYSGTRTISINDAVSSEKKKYKNLTNISIELIFK